MRFGVGFLHPPMMDVFRILGYIVSVRACACVCVCTYVCVRFVKA